MPESMTATVAPSPRAMTSCSGPSGSATVGEQDQVVSVPTTAVHRTKRVLMVLMVDGPILDSCIVFV